MVALQRPGNDSDRCSKQNSSVGRLGGAYVTPIPMVDAGAQVAGLLAGLQALRYSVSAKLIGIDDPLSYE